MGWIEEMKNADPPPDPRASPSVISCGIIISNIGSIDFRLTEILSYVSVLRNRYHWRGGNKMPPLGGLYDVHAACGGSAPLFVTGAAIKCIPRAK
jgi:hypothetical protein